MGIGGDKWPRTRHITILSELEPSLRDRQFIVYLLCFLRHLIQNSCWTKFRTVTAKAVVLKSKP